MPGGGDTDTDDGTPDLPTDQELAAYFRETWNSDDRDTETWVEHFGFEDVEGKPRRDLDDRVREFFMEYVGPQPEE